MKPRSRIPVPGQSGIGRGNPPASPNNNPGSPATGRPTNTSSSHSSILDFAPSNAALPSGYRTPPPSSQLHRSSYAHSDNGAASERGDDERGVHSGGLGEGRGRDGRECVCVCAGYLHLLVDVSLLPLSLSLLLCVLAHNANGCQLCCSISFIHSTPEHKVKGHTFLQACTDAVRARVFPHTTDFDRMSVGSVQKGPELRPPTPTAEPKSKAQRSNVLVGVRLRPLR